MANFSLSKDEISQIADEIRDVLVPIIIDQLNAERDLPPLLTRKQFMELVDIGPTKCNELFNRVDFPVTREFGNPKVPTQLFIEWMNKKTHEGKRLGFKAM